MKTSLLKSIVVALTVSFALPSQAQALRNPITIAKEKYTQIKEKYNSQTYTQKEAFWSLVVGLTYWTAVTWFFFVKLPRDCDKAGREIDAKYYAWLSSYIEKQHMSEQAKNLAVQSQAYFSNPFHN